jgi:superfamily II DNA or RNA helicase
LKPIKVSVEEPMIIIANYAVMSTGISIKSLENVVLLSSLKAFTTIVQVIGRLLRLHKSKAKAHLYDLIDDVSKINPRSVKENYVLKHFYQRLEYYRDEN